LIPVGARLSIKAREVNTTPPVTPVDDPPPLAYSLLAAAIWLGRLKEVARAFHSRWSQGLGSQTFKVPF
jgi:hypothetical protein